MSKLRMLGLVVPQRLEEQIMNTTYHSACMVKHYTHIKDYWKILCVGFHHFSHKAGHRKTQQWKCTGLHAECVPCLSLVPWGGSAAEVEAASDHVPQVVTRERGKNPHVSACSPEPEKPKHTATAANATEKVCVPQRHLGIAHKD